MLQREKTDHAEDYAEIGQEPDVGNGRFIAIVGCAVVVAVVLALVLSFAQ
jgi:hypothetical protein